MAGYQYLDNYNNPDANVTTLNVGDYLTSPSGVYNGVLNSNGTFTVSYGSVPNTQPALWTSDNPNAAGPYAVQSVPWYSTSQYYVFVPCNCTNPSGGKVSPSDDQLAVNQDNSTAPDFMQLNDSGQLVIYQGNNGIKTNANEASVQTRTPGTANNTTSITLNTITYDTADTTYNATNKLIGLESTATNNTPVTQSYPYNVSLAYTDSETFTWNVSATLSATISSSTKITIPGIGDQTETISLTGSTTISQGQSTTQTQTTTISAGGNTSVPEFSQFVVYETAEEQIATVPYTWTGIAYYANGVSAPITGSGSVVSDTTGLFNIETDCVYTPDGCTTVGLGSPPAVPEPPTIITVPLAFAALLALAAVRRRRRRGTLRDNGLGMLSPA